MHTDHLATLSSIRHRNAFRCAFYNPESPVNMLLHNLVTASGWMCLYVCAVVLLSIITLQPHKEGQQMVREKQPEEVPERACIPSLNNTKPSCSVSYT